MSLVKSLVIPAALALSLVATESSAWEVKKFERSTESTSEVAAAIICTDFKIRRGNHYKAIKQQVITWLTINKINHPGTVYHRDGISADVQKTSKNKWRCNMAWTFWYTLGMQASL